jgi:hypothetical protein
MRQGILSVEGNIDCHPLVTQTLGHRGGELGMVFDD